MSVSPKEGGYFSFCTACKIIQPVTDKQLLPLHEAHAQATGHKRGAEIRHTNQPHFNDVVARYDLQAGQLKT